MPWVELSGIANYANGGRPGMLLPHEDGPLLFPRLIAGIPCLTGRGEGGIYGGVVAVLGFVFLTREQNRGIRAKPIFQPSTSPAVM